MSNESKIEIATFAGGCFWCLQPVYDEMDGVLATRVGYMGGTKTQPTYEEVSSGKTGHAEVIQVEYDADEVSYENLLDAYWQNIDPMRSDGQFCDRGSQYRPSIFYHNEAQKKAAEKSKKALIENKKMPVLVEIVPATTFYPAEEYHQKYYEKSSTRYQFYHDHSGREKRLKDIWGEGK